MKQISVLLCVFFWWLIPAWHIMGVFVACDLRHICNAHNLWPWLGFLQTCFRNIPEIGFASRIPESLFLPPNEYCILRFWRLDLTQLTSFCPFPMSAHTLFVRTLYCHLLDPAKLANPLLKALCQTMQTRVDYGQQRLFGTQQASEYFYLPLGTGCIVATLLLSPFIFEKLSLFFWAMGRRGWI